MTPTRKHYKKPLEGPWLWLLLLGGTMTAIMTTTTTIIGLVSVSVVTAWVTTPPVALPAFQRLRPRREQDSSSGLSRPSLFLGGSDEMDDDQDLDEESENEHDDDYDNEGMENSSPSPSQPTTCRVTKIAGVSVERDSGFWVMVEVPSILSSTTNAAAAAAVDDNKNHNNNDDNSSTTTTATGHYWAIPITNDPMDRLAASSGPALTLVQLLSQVDMAGMVFPPNRLAQLLICGIEEEHEEEEMENTSNDDEKSTVMASKEEEEFIHKNNDHDHNRQWLLQSVKRQIQAIIHSFRRRGSSQQDQEEEDYSYTEASNWIRSRVSLPLCTLDQVQFHLQQQQHNNNSFFDLSACQLDVVVTTNKEKQQEQSQPQPQRRWTYSLNLTESTVAQALLEDYQPFVSRNFLLVALALRYKTPILMTTTTTTSETMASDDNDEFFSSLNALRYYTTVNSLQEDFPMFVTVNQLQQTSNRVIQKIEYGFEYYQLQAAWKIARQKQDFAAMAKIQTKLDELEQRHAQEQQAQQQQQMQQQQHEENPESPTQKDQPQPQESYRKNRRSASSTTTTTTTTTTSSVINSLEQIPVQPDSQTDQME